MGRFFNTAGPINPQMHYFLPNRLDEAAIAQLIAERKYFILHAPRQSGKTTGIRKLVDDINAIGKYKAIYVNFEPAQAMRGRVNDAMEVLVSELTGQQALEFPQDDLSYVIDLGLIRQDENKNLVIANPIYQGPKTLTEGLAQTVDYMDKNNSIEGHLLAIKLDWF